MILTNFFQRIFTIDPTIRLTPEQAASHPFLHSKYNKHDFIDDVVTITKNYSMDDVVRSIYQHHLSLSYLQSQNFTVQKYYQTYIKALHAGFVLNVLHVNPFRRTPFKCGIHPYVPMQEDSSIASEDELPPITPPTRIPPRCRSRSLNLGVMEECELPPIDFVVPNTTRQMVTTPTKNQLHSLRPPPQCPRSGLALSPRQVSHRVLTVF
ncbi:Protein kinase domain containing protein [Entamoeba marina]